jgi:EF-hand domain-containing protein 1
LGSNVLQANAIAAEKAQTARDSQPASQEVKPWEKDTSEVFKFYAYYQETVPESREETNRCRCFVIKCHTFDQSIQVTEVKRANSGISQGDFIKRGKVPKPVKNGSTIGFNSTRIFSNTASSIMGTPRATEFYGVNDFKVGSTVNLYGRQFFVNGCDDKTRSYLDSKNGNGTTAPNQPFPEDNFDNMAMGQGVHNWQKNWEENGGSFACKDSFIKRYVEASRGRADRVHPDAPGGLRRYLTQGDRVLNYNLLWKDNRLNGRPQVFVLNIFLKDNTMEILYPHGTKEGRGDYKKYMIRSRFQKPEMVNRGAMAWRGFSDIDGPYYEPVDIQIGNKYIFNKREMLVFDAAEDTCKWYEDNYGINMRDKRMNINDLIPPKPEVPKLVPPPNTLGIGSEEDTLQAWKSLRPKAIKKDEVRLVQYEGKILRFAAKFTKPRYIADQTRQFIVSYFLADGTVKVFEPVQPNSGQQGGKYLERRIMRNPATGKYFAEKDFTVGEKVTIASTEFQLLGCDNFTKKYLAGDLNLHEMKGIDEVENLLREKIAANAVNIRKSFRKADKDFSGAITYDEFSQMLLEMGLHLHEHDVALLMKKYDHDHDGEISYGEFCHAMIAQDYTDRSKGAQRKSSFHSGADGHEEMTHDQKLQYLEHMKALKVSNDQQRRLNRYVFFLNDSILDQLHMIIF